MEDMALYFHYLDGNWEDVVDENCSEGLTEKKVQELVWKKYAESNNKSKPQSKPQKKKAKIKEIVPYELKNPYLENLSVNNNHDHKGSDGADNIEITDIENMTAQKHIEITAESTDDSVVTEKDAFVERIAAVKPKTKKDIDTANRKPKSAYKPKFTVKKREKLEDSSITEKYPFCAKLMGKDTSLDEKVVNPAKKIESDIVKKKSNSRLVSESLGTSSHQDSETVFYRDACTNAVIDLDISEDIDNPSEDSDSDNPTSYENVKSPSSNEPTMSEEDGNKIKYKCNVCGKEYTYLKGLENHECFKKLVKIPCPSCSKLVSKTNLSHHIKIHSRIKFPCTTCKKAFKSKPNLEKHLLKHGQKKKTLCDECGKVFARPNHLKLHMKTHSKEVRTEAKKPRKGVRCKMCNEECTSNSKLLAHFKKFHPEASTKCTVCSKPFFSKRGLDGHMKKHSNVPPDNTDHINAVAPESSSLVIENLDNLQPVIADGFFEMDDFSVQYIDIDVANSYQIN